MANPEHVAILKQGVEEWNRWKEQRLKKRLEWKMEHSGKLDIETLRHADIEDTLDLSNVDLSGADLSGVDFSGTNLDRANLSDAHLQGSSFTEAGLNETNLSRAVRREVT